MKYCPKCRENKDIIKFHRDSYKKDGLKVYCIDCAKLVYSLNKEKLKVYGHNYYKENKKRLDLYQKERRFCNLENDKLINRRGNLKHYYNLTIENYNDLFEQQGGRCAICGTHQSELKEPLFVDHDHTTKKVRGLLCRACNTGIGFLKDDRNLLLKAVNYLEDIK